MNHISRAITACSVLVMGCAFTLRAHAVALNDARALHGLHSVKSVFLINKNNPGALAKVLKVVGLTDTGMAKQGVKARLIVVVIGPSVAFLTKDLRGIPYTQRAAVSHVQAFVKKLHHMGVRFEACGVALSAGVDIPPGDMIPDVKPVGNGFISAIGYQAQGYELVPVF